MSSVSRPVRSRFHLDWKHPLTVFPGIGPLVGSMLLYFGCAAFIGSGDLPMPNYPITPFLVVGYVAGVLPAAFTGLLFGFLRRRSSYLPHASPARRGLLMGTVCGLAVMFPIEALGILSHGDLAVLTNVLTLCGTVAGGVCGALCRAPFPAVDQPVVLKTPPSAAGPTAS